MPEASKAGFFNLLGNANLDIISRAFDFGSAIDPKLG
jgi:hypothetical protein